MVMLLLPASSANSTYSSCKNKNFAAVVFAQLEETVGVETIGDTVDDAVGEADGDTAAGGVAGSAGEKVEDGRLIELREMADGWNERDQKIFARDFPARLQPQRSREAG